MLPSGIVIVIYKALRTAFSLYEFIILGRVILTWINISPYSKVSKFFSDLADPYLGFIERYMPEVLRAPLNFTPIVALMLLSVIERVIYRLLFLLV